MWVHLLLAFSSGDANHAREVAQQELTRVKGGYEEERRRREQELRERHQVREPAIPSGDASMDDARED